MKRVGGEFLAPISAYIVRMFREYPVKCDVFVVKGSCDAIIHSSS